MLKKLVIIIPILLFVCFFWWLIFGGIPIRVNTGFATKVILKQRQSDGRTLNVAMIEAKDAKAIKNLLRGWATHINSEPFAEYSDFTSITLTDGRHQMVFYPCVGEKDRRVNVGDTDRYRHLSESQKKTLVSICKKYKLFID